MRTADSTIASPPELSSERADRARWGWLRRALGAARRAPKRAALGAIELYRMTAPVRTPRCRYIPSCSAYAAEAIEVHGLGRGLWLAIRRLGRCHPFGSFGFDPVPERIDDQHGGDGSCDGSTEHGETSAPERSDGTERNEHGTQPERI